MNVVLWLRVSLGFVFFWFGALKVAGVSPVFEIVNATIPFLATPTGLVLLGIFEIVVGIALLFNVAPRFACYALIAHLIGTLFSFVRAPDLLFSPAFPALSLLGEFVVKNVVLIAAAIGVLDISRRTSH